MSGKPGKSGLVGFDVHEVTFYLLWLGFTLYPARSAACITAITFSGGSPLQRTERRPASGSVNTASTPGTCLIALVSSGPAALSMSATSNSVQYGSGLEAKAIFLEE